MAEATTTTTTTKKSGHHPAFISVVGIGFLILFVIGLMTQVQTNEAFITNAGQVNLYKPNWDILMQLPALIMGNLGASEAAATVFGWGIELIYLGFIIGFEVLQNAASASGHLMAGIFKVGAIGIILFNGWTDYHYGSLGGGTWGHWGFAIMTSFIVGFFGTIGIYLLGIGWKRA